MDKDTRNGHPTNGLNPRGSRRPLGWAVAGLLAAAVFFAAALLHRSAGRQDAESARFPVSGHLPPDFWTDTSPEAAAFRSACGQCHALPSPNLYDEDGWEAIASKMDRVIRERGLNIPRRQVDLAIAYATRMTQRRPRAQPADVTPPDDPAVPVETTTAP